jgi:hypothetical protein
MIKEDHEIYTQQAMKAWDKTLLRTSNVSSSPRLRRLQRKRREKKK